MRKLSLLLSEEAYHNLERLRKKQGKKSKADFLRGAVALMAYVEEQKDAGKQIGVLHNGSVEKWVVWE